MSHTYRFDTENEAEACKFLQRGLYVEPPSRPIDLDTVPMNGTEYIHLQRLVDSTIVYAEIPSPEAEKKSPPKTNCKIEKCSKNEAKAFKIYASRLKRDKDTLKVKFPKKIETPEKGEKEWCVFCMGFEICTIIFDTQDLCPDSEEAHSPVLSIVLHLSQEEILLLLKYHYRWFKKIGMIDGIGEWVYALLACLEDSDSEDVQAVLKDFYATCKGYSSNCDESQEHQVNLILSIIENCFLFSK